MHSRKSYISARIVAAFIAGLAIVVGAVVVAPAAYAGTDDYPAKWKNATRDSMFDSWGEYNRECTSWVAWRLHGHNKFEMPFHGNADDWGAKAKKLGYTVNKTPAVGSVAWWDTSTRSHVAWVEAVNPNNTVTIEEYNIGGSGRYDETTIATSSPSGYIHFQDLATSFANGAYITYQNNVYRMAGGAPVYVSSWASFGKTPTGLVSAAKWATLKSVPKDGTYLQGSTSKAIYEIVGGAPIFVSSWAVVGGTKPVVVVPDADITNAGSGVSAIWRHLNKYPTGTQIITATPSNKQYTIVNGAPVPVTPTPTTTTAATKSTTTGSASTAAVKPTSTTTPKPTATPTATPKPTPTPTATPKPTPTPTPAPVSTIKIGDDVIANAGTATSGKYAHLRGYIPLPTPSISGTPRYRHTITVHLAPWASKGFTVTYQWYRNGVPIAAGKGTTYSLASVRNLGKTITVRVTASKTNYVTESLSSASVHITK